MLVLPLMDINTMKTNTARNSHTTMTLRQLTRQWPSVLMTRTVLQLKIDGQQEKLQSAFAKEQKENELEEGHIS